jgi:uncharacterized membrane protein
VDCDRPRLRALGFPAGDSNVEVQALSGDGSVVLGESSNAEGLGRAFTWTSERGFEILEPHPGDDSAFGTNLSLDGSVVVGSSGGWRAVRWVASASPELLEPSQGGSDPLSESIAQSVSADGLNAVGWRVESVAVPVIWIEGGETVVLGVPPGLPSRGTGISADGNVVVGCVAADSEIGAFEEPFRWTSELGVQTLELPEGTTSGCAVAVSDDGATTVGVARSGINWHPVRWADGSPPQVLFGGDGSVQEVNADGSVIIAWREDAGGTSIVWDEEHGARSLQDALDASGVDYAGWTELIAVGVSADGRVLAGIGILDRKHQSWIVRL